MELALLQLKRLIDYILTFAFFGVTLHSSVFIKLNVCLCEARYVYISTFFNPICSNSTCLLVQAGRELLYYFDQMANKEGKKLIKTLLSGISHSN